MSNRPSRNQIRSSERMPRSRTRVITRNLSAPPVITAIPKYRNFKNKNRSNPIKASDFVTDALGVISKSLNDPNVLMIIGITTVICFTHISDTVNGPLGQVVAKMKANASTKALGDWLGTNITKMVGLLIFLPTVFSLPKTKRMMCVVIIATWVIFIPESSILQYSLQAVLLLLFYRLPKSGDRLVLLGILLTTYVFGNISMLVPISTVTPPK